MTEAPKKKYRSRVAGKTPWRSVAGSAAVPVGSVLILIAALSISPLPFIEGIHAGFYVVTAEVIPVLLIAVLIRHSWTGDVLAEVRSEMRDSYAEFAVRKEHLEEALRDRHRNGESTEETVSELAKVEEELREAFDGLEGKWHSAVGVTIGAAVGSLMLAIWGETAALVAIAFDLSTAATLVPIILAMIWMSGHLALGEILRFEQRLFPLSEVLGEPTRIKPGVSAGA